MAWITLENTLGLLVQRRQEVDQLRREASIDRIKVRQKKKNIHNIYLKRKITLTSICQNSELMQY